MIRIVWTLVILGCAFLFSSCGNSSGASQETANAMPILPTSTPNLDIKSTPTLTEPIATTNSPIGKFDFKNYTYPLPRGWQDQDGEVSLENGKAPVSTVEDARKIGASFVKTKFGDVTSDGQDEAFVVIKLETGGSAIPQMVYVFEWKNDKPEIIWYFRTGDRSDGGLKDIRAENGELVVELFGQDRYIFGEVETLKIVGDEEQLCCPTHFTRNRYKLTGSRFVMQGKRETYSIAEPNAPPIENMGEVNQVKSKK